MRTSRMNSLLCSPWLRRVGARLRVEHPGLYAGLNRVCRKRATGGSGLDLYQHVALERFASFTPIAGARVLEIGSDFDLKVLAELGRLGVGDAFGINNADELWSKRNERTVVVNERARLVQGDARRLQFEDGAFDAVFSVATFEHILDLPAALREMARVLKPGGVLYSNFGPIWSAGKGHHVYAVVGDHEARHFYSDYVRIFQAAPFSLVSLREESDPVAPQLRRLLGFRYPGEVRFDVTNIEVVLRKSEA